MKYVLMMVLAVGLVGCASPGGIGVLFNKKGVVKHVFEKSPAEEAGILVEDVIFNTKELRGPIGSICTVKGRSGKLFYERKVMRADVETFRIERQDYGGWDHKK